MATAEEFQLVFTFAGVPNIATFDSLVSLMTPSGETVPAVRILQKTESGSLTQTNMPIFTRRIRTKADVEDLRQEVTETFNQLLDNLAAKAFDVAHE